MSSGPLGVAELQGASTRQPPTRTHRRCCNAAPRQAALRVLRQQGLHALAATCDSPAGAKQVRLIRQLEHGG